jgi:hypothetical protein
LPGRASRDEANAEKNASFERSLTLNAPGASYRLSGTPAKLMLPPIVMRYVLPLLKAPNAARPFGIVSLSV